MEDEGLAPVPDMWDYDPADLDRELMWTLSGIRADEAPKRAPGSRTRIGRAVAPYGGELWADKIRSFGVRCHRCGASQDLLYRDGKLICQDCYF